MGPLATVLLRRKATEVIPHLLREQVSRNGLNSLSTFRFLATTSTASHSPSRPSRLRGEDGKRTVAVFWDLDNKSPKRVPPFEAATRLKEMAGTFGEVVGVVAYANHHAFEHIPPWVHEERQQRKVLDILEQAGEVVPNEPYVCGVCGAKKKTHVQLIKHFKMLHEKEQRKRMSRLDMLKSKKKQKERFLDNNAPKLMKYKEASRGIIQPKVGYGLMQDIRRAGVYVRTVKDEPQAADVALKDHMMRSINKGVNCICLVSDDTDFKPELKMAKERSLHTVVVGDLKILEPFADTYFSWGEVASGRAEQKAKIINGQLVLGEIPEGVALGVDIRDYEPEEIPIEDDVSDTDLESDEDWTWQPIDRRRPEIDDSDAFDYFDDFSDSDSEKVEKVKKMKRKSKLHGGFTPSKIMIKKRVPMGSRSFTTARDTDQNGEPPKESSTTGSKSPSAEAGYIAPKPERLHPVFTQMEVAFRGHPTTRGKSARRRVPGREEIYPERLRKETKDPLDFQSRKDVVSSSKSDDRTNESAQQFPSSSRSDSTADNSTEQESPRFSKSDPTADNSAEQDLPRFPKSDSTVDNSAEQELPRSSMSDSTAENSAEQELPTSSRSDSEVNETDGEYSSSSDSELEIEEVEPERRSPRTRKTPKRTGPKRARIKMTPEGPVKITRVGPRPFYLSGFASESQAACDAVDKYHAEWWGDDDDTEVYRGRQDRKRKTKVPKKKSV